ncbi:MAG: DUF1295 domain-containing protein [Hyphomicrobiaceae bacterium]
MDVVTLLATAMGIWLSLAVLMAGAWWIEQRTGNSGWVDVVWTFAIGLTGLFGATVLVGDGAPSNRQLLVASLILVWALRLAGHIVRRTTSVSDDPRYRKLRDQWGDAASRNMFLLLQAQAMLSVPMVLTVVLAAGNPAELFTSLDGVAALVLCSGLAGSAVADWQLTRFKQKNPSTGRVCNTGLWSWSRHPNYFFEWLMWLGFALLAIDVSGGSLWGYLAFVGPICMFWLLRYVSGVPPLEEHMLAKYGSAYEAYQRETSVFLPFPPRARAAP